MLLDKYCVNRSVKIFIVENAKKHLFGVINMFNYNKNWFLFFSNVKFYILAATLIKKKYYGIKIDKYQICNLAGGILYSCFKLDFIHLIIYTDRVWVKRSRIGYAMKCRKVPLWSTTCLGFHFGRNAGAL